MGQKMTKEVSARFIHEKEGILASDLLLHVPRVGDDIRFSDKAYYKVTIVCWVYDELDCPFARVNIGVVDLENYT